ncbi:hypothetical protein ACHAXA_002194 [Cyclostephanos tholiformis]|uniref:Uncharacterized protein n=1 Tax=Cyclostephanos tholiformis TaxID=382380 RepID=A0ABD3R5H8_9STRA
MNFARGSNLTLVSTNCLKESKSDQLLEICRRAFQKVEGGGGQAGFIPVEKLGEVLQELDLKPHAECGEELQTFQAYLEVAGAGIILWDDFWKACSRLMTGSSLESILATQDAPMQVDANDKSSIHNGPPLFITQFGADKIVPMTSAPLHQSDEELAKKLAVEWGSLPDQGEILTGISDSVHGQNMKSDEDYARELQAIWNAEIIAASHASIEESGNFDLTDLTSQVATTDDVGALESDSDDHCFAKSPTPSVGTTATTATISNDETTDNIQEKSRGNQLGLEEQGHSFSLFHYNGLHGGKLTHLRLTRLSPTDAVGASSALSSKGISGHGAGSCDLEDVVRTKWPSSVMNWFGQNPPSIE